MKHEQLRVIGSAIERTDAREKVTGQARYTVDFSMPEMLHAKVLRSAKAHAKILSIDTADAEKVAGVKAVLTGRDLQSDDLAPVYGYYIKDQPILAMDRVRYEGDMVAAVAAVDERAANEALALIKVTYAELPLVPDVETALSDGAPELFEEKPFGVTPPYGQGASAQLWPRPNVSYEFHYTTGENAFKDCDHVFEDEFCFSRMHHFHLEPFVTVARWNHGEIEVVTSCQNPFPLRKEIARIFKMPENRITVRVPFIGGGFGAKNNCKTEPVAILLSKMTGRPIRFCLTLEEGFLTNTQHSAILRLKTGVTAAGKLVARESRILLDAGAYTDGSPLVAEKAGYRIPGAYRYRYIDTVCSCVMTNTTPAGPFRGFGGTQATWACESQIDMIARRLSMDPLVFRKQNLLKLGDPFVPGESGVDSDLELGLDLVAREIGYERPRKPGHGIGLSIGFKDGGGVNKPAQARVKVSTSGDIYLQCGTVEIGQGSQTALSQLVAEIMGCSLNKVVYLPLDTRYTPFDQGTNASSAVTVMGQAVARAANSLKRQILEFAADRLGADIAELRLENWCVLQSGKSHPLSPMIVQTFGGTGFEFSADGFHKAKSDDAPLDTPAVFWEVGWAGVEISVDKETGQVLIHKLVVSGDAGRAIHKLVCRGQDEGAALMGLGQTFYERMIYRGTHLVNGEALMYRLPLAEDLPEVFTTITQEQGHGPGPFGAKGVGEGLILPIASAIANAIEDAVGVRLKELPLTPERVLNELNRCD